MFDVQGKEIYMACGDFGVPLPFRVEECCRCAEDLLDSDALRFSLTRNGKELVGRRWTLGELAETEAFFVELTEEESGRLPVGVYSWRIQLVRKGETVNTLLGGLWIVKTLVEGACCQ